MASAYMSFWRICLVLFLGFILGFSIRTIYNLTAYQPCYWKHDPVIINCTGKAIKEETIQNAIKFWKEKGEHVYFYEYDYRESICNKKESVYGFIVLKTQTEEILEKDVLASTSRESKLGIIQASTIIFKPGTHNLALLLEHELGHAFGYGHVKIPGHIMHPYYDMVGTKFW